MDFNIDSNYRFYGKSFFDEYAESIAPRLQMIDVLLRTSKFPLSLSETSKSLNLSNDEVMSILGQLNMSEINKPVFFAIMRNGTSDICQLFRREVECGSPHMYNPRHISYIYGLDLQTVERVFHDLHVSEVTASLFPALFTKIPARDSSRPY